MPDEVMDILNTIAGIGARLARMRARSAVIPIAPGGVNFPGMELLVEDIRNLLSESLAADAEAIDTCGNAAVLLARYDHFRVEFSELSSVELATMVNPAREGSETEQHGNQLLATTVRKKWRSAFGNAAYDDIESRVRALVNESGRRFPS